MEQAQFRITLSVGTKLLISLVLLLVIVIVTLNLSAIFVLTKDKRDTVYQQQSSDVFMAGKDFVSTAQKQIDTLRLALSALDPSKPTQWASKKETLQALVDNQGDLAVLKIRKLDAINLTLEPVFEVSKADALEKLNLTVDQLKVPQQLWKEVVPGVLKHTFGFVNATEVGTPPFLAVVVADTKVPISENNYLVAVGYLSLKGLLQSSQTDLTIADRTGWVLFDSNTAQQYEKFNIINDPQFEKAINTPLSTGTLEFFTDEGRFLGSFYKPGFDVVVLGKTEWNFAMRAAFALVERFVLIGVIAIGLAVIFALLYSKTMTAPLNQLFEATKEIAHGNFNINLKVQQKDEIGALSESFNVMSRQIVGLIDDKLKKAHLENELAIASTVQQTLIPPPEIETNALRIHSAYRSASQCGGDWWGYFTVGSYACFAVADATGHGFPSALITASMKSCYSVIEKLFQDQPTQRFSPSEILSYANRAVYDSARGQIMMTLFLGVLDLRTGLFTYSCAAHNPPWLFKKSDGGYAHNSLVATGQRLGEAYTVPPYEEKTIQFDPGDIFFMYTDGLIEGKNQAGDEYSKKKTLKKAKEFVAHGTKGIIDGFTDEVQTHNQGKDLDDDVTLAAIQILKLG